MTLRSIRSGPTVLAWRPSRREAMRLVACAGGALALPPGVLPGFAQDRPAASDALVDAVRAGDVETVRAILDREPGLKDAVDDEGRSILVWANLAGQPTVADAILERDPQLDLVEAVLAENQDRFIALAQATPSLVNADHPVGGTAYYAAARLGKRSMIWPLNRWGGDPNANPRGRDGVTALRAALDDPDRARAKATTLRILGDQGDPSAPQRDGDSVLHGAVAHGDAELVAAIIRRGGSVLATNAGGETPLDVALRLGHAEAADVLRRHDEIPRTHSTSRQVYDAGFGRYAAPERLDVDQLTVNEFVEVCHYSLDDATEVFRQHPQVLHGLATWDEIGVEACAHMEQGDWTRFFLDQGAPMSLATALAVGDVAAARRLLEEDPLRVHERGPHDFALMWYPQIAGGDVELAALLLEFGADVDEEKWGITCLHKAARQGHRDLVTYLLAHGADVNAFGRSDFSALFGTPLDWALSNGQQEVAGLLRDAGGRQGRDRALPGQTGPG